MKHVLGGLATLFLIGCATTGPRGSHDAQAAGEAASPAAAPPARAGTTPTRWETFCADVDPDELTEATNQAGAEGWDLVSVAPHQRTGSLGTVHDTFIFCAKRALPAGPP